MKRWFPLLLLLIVCVSLAVPALAVGEEEEAVPPVIEVPSDDNSVADPVDDPLSVEDDSNSISVPISGDTALTVPEEITGSVFNFDLNFNGAVQPVLYTSTEIVLDGSTEVRPGLAGAVSSIFGNYTPLCYTVDTVIDGVVVDTDIQVVPGLAGLDWEWIGGMFLFAVMLYCFLKMIGGLLS